MLSAVPQSNLYVAIYFYAFLVIGSFFAVNLFVGVVIDKFSRMKEDFNGSAFQTKDQKEWSDMQRLLRSIKPKLKTDRPESCVRAAVYDTTIHPYFDITIMCCIMVNTLTMAMEHYEQSEEYVLSSLLSFHH